MHNLKKYFDKKSYIELYGRFQKSILWKRIFKNFSIGIFGSGANILLSLAKMAILTKTLSLSNYGVVMIVVNFYAFVNMILDVKINDVLFRFMPDFREKGDEKAVAGIINLCLLICGLIMVISFFTIMFFSDWIAIKFYNNPQIGTLLVIYLLAGAFNVLRGFSTGILRLKDKFAHIVVPQVLGNFAIVICLLVYFFVWEEKELTIVTAIIAFGTLLGLLIPLYFSLKLTREVRKSITTKESLYSLTAYKEKITATILQTNIASYLKLGSETGGIFLLGVFGSSVQVALYNVAFQMVKPLKVLQDNVQPAVYPEIVKFYAEKRFNALKSLVKKTTLVNILAGSVCLIVAYFLIDTVLLIFTTSEYLDAVPVFMIIVSTIFLTFISLCFYPLTVVMDQLKWRNFIVSLRFIFLGAVYFIGFSAVNVAWAQFIGSLTTRTFNDLPLYKKLNNKVKE